MPNFNSIGSGVSEPQVAENCYLPLTGDIALTTCSVCTNVLHCDAKQQLFDELILAVFNENTRLANSNLYIKVRSGDL